MKRRWFYFKTTLRWFWKLFILGDDRLDVAYVCAHHRDFEEFKRHNSDLFKLSRVSNINDVDGKKFDFFIKGYGWEAVSEEAMLHLILRCNWSLLDLNFKGKVKAHYAKMKQTQIPKW